MKKLLPYVASILALAFLLAAMNDFVMGCGEGYWTAQGFVQPDNKGCIFSSKKE